MNLPAKKNLHSLFFVKFNKHLMHSKSTIYMYFVLLELIETKKCFIFVK